MKRRIAVIEDETSIAASVAARLRAEGFEVETAADALPGSSSAQPSVLISSCST